jgi:uncharacterized membrane protein
MTIGLPLRNPSTVAQPFLSVPFRWAIRVLAWLAFGLASYLAIKSLGHEVISGCITGGADCKDVQSSAWSMWLGLPVAIAGLACYASLATLSVFTGVTNPRAAYWVGTGLVLLSLIAALSGLWFSSIQFFVIGKLCWECMAVHLCGITIAVLVLYGILKDRPRGTVARAAAPGLAALRAAIPAPAGATAPIAGRTPVAPIAGRATSVPTLIGTRQLALKTARPSFAIAGGGAALILLALIGGQLLFPAEGSTHARIDLANAVHLDEPAGDASDASSGNSAAKEPHVARKIPTDLPANDAGVKNAADARSEKGKTDLFPTADPAAGDGGASTMADLVPPKKRVVTLLNGKLSLDVYRHPVIGSPEAPHIVLEFVSYDCPHCHHMAKIVRRALDRYGNQVAVVVLVMPKGIECNKEVTSASASIPGACIIARMALSVAKLEPEKFTKFHDWLMEGKEKPPSPAQVVQKAYNTAGRDRINKLSQDDFQKQVNQTIDLFNLIKDQRPPGAKEPGLPLLILGNELHSGVPTKEEEFIRSWEDFLGVKPARATDASTL